jgi:hypothetical protein
MDAGHHNEEVRQRPLVSEMIYIPNLKLNWQVCDLTF